MTDTPNVAAIRAALECLPDRCRYHGDQTEPPGGHFRQKACCDSGLPAHNRKLALAALDRVVESARLMAIDVDALTEDNICLRQALAAMTTPCPAVARDNAELNRQVATLREERDEQLRATEDRWRRILELEADNARLRDSLNAMTAPGPALT